MVFQRGSTSTDNLPFAMKRSHCVKISSPLNTPNQLPESAWNGYEDMDDDEIITAAKLPTSSPWIQRGSAVPTRAPRQILTSSAPALPLLSTKQKLLVAMNGGTKRKAPASRKRARKTDPTESDEEAERCAKNINAFEDRSEEEDEPTSGDERFVADDDEEEEEDSEDSLMSTDDDEEASGSEYSGSEAEFSTSSSEEDEEDNDHCGERPEHESSEDEEEVVSVRNPMTAHEKAIMSKSVAALQISRRLKPLVIMADSHIANIVVSMFWAWHRPAVHDMLSLDDALVDALDLVLNNKPLTTSDLTIGAGYVWLINHAKLRRNLAENYDSPALHEWLDAVVKSENVDDTPVFIYARKKTQRCFLNDTLCNRGVQLVSNDSKKPIATLWFDATDESTNTWVLNMVRFLFLPATLAEFCTHTIGKRGAPLGEKETLETYTWVNDISAEFAQFLFQEGVCKVRTGVLDCEFTRNYVK